MSLSDSGPLDGHSPVEGVTASSSKGAQPVTTTQPPPDFLTIEEAAQILRIGRTVAYAQAKEWRATGGESGLPVVSFGRVLRVPRAALAALAGGELAGSAVPESTPDDPEPAPPRARRTKPVPLDQPSLFASTPEP